MKHSPFKLVILGLLCIPSGLHAADVARVYLDGAHNVHLETADGKDAKVTTAGNAGDPLLSEDGRTVAWLVEEHFAADVDGNPILGSQQLVVYRSGRQQSISCEPLLRDFWFWKRGTRVVIECGGLHFAGRQALYDASTLNQIDSFDESVVPLEDRPEWSRDNPEFSAH